MSGTVHQTDIDILQDRIEWGTANCARFKDMKDKEQNDENKNLIQ